MQLLNYSNLLFTPSSGDLLKVEHREAPLACADRNKPSPLSTTRVSRKTHPFMTVRDSELAIDKLSGCTKHVCTSQYFYRPQEAEEEPVPGQLRTC